VLRARSARELHAVWTALGAPAASEEARVAALAAARGAAQGSCAAPAHELLALAAREADLLSRHGLDYKCMVGICLELHAVRICETACVCQAGACGLSLSARTRFSLTISAPAGAPCSTQQNRLLF